MAGIVDGEGSFIIYLKAGGKRRDRKFHRCMLSIANTDLPLIEFLQEHLGGRIDKTTPKEAHHKVVYHLIIEGTRVAEVTHILLPYLRIKRTQAELVLEMLKTMTTNTGKPLPAETLAIRQEIYSQYVEAKHGPSRTWGGRKLA